MNDAQRSPTLRKSSARLVSGIVLVVALAAGARAAAAPDPCLSFFSGGKASTASVEKLSSAEAQKTAMERV